MIRVTFEKISDLAKIPSMSYGDLEAGVDLCSADAVSIDPDESAIVPTGLRWKPEFGGVDPTQADLKNFFLEHFKIYMQIKSRSGLAAKHGIDVKAGVIDSTYRGEIKIVLHNRSDEPYAVFVGDRIAQGVIHVVPRVVVAEGVVVFDSDRGENGFGSSGR